MLRIPDETVYKDNIHRANLAAFMDTSGDLGWLGGRAQSDELILVCFTNRCGSNYLCDLLYSSGEFNLGGEFFNFDTVIANIQLHKLGTFQRYFQHLFNLARNGRLVCKASIDQIVLLARAGVLDRLFPRTRFVYVERGDSLGQAISLAIAHQTRQWMSYSPAEVDASKILFSRDVISALVAHIAKENYLFKLFFGLNGITPYHLTYEELHTNMQPCMAKLCDWLGMSGARPQLEKIRMQKQASGTNRLWREMYLAEA